MCEAYWDTRLSRWVSFEDLEGEALKNLTTVGIGPLPSAAEPQRRPTALLR
jgi:hypothetical protein